MCGSLGQNLQEDWTILIVTTFIECINESVLGVARKVADEVKEDRILHQL